MLAIDQITKLWLRSVLRPGESLPEIGSLTVTHIHNTGSAFGLFANQAFLLSLIAVVGLVVILLFYRHLSQSSILGNIVLGLVFGGAVGNLTDRIRLGYVTDFIYIRLWHDFYWPAFNIADSAITIGVLVLICSIILGLKKENGHPS